MQRAQKFEKKDSFPTKYRPDIRPEIAVWPEIAVCDLLIAVYDLGGGTFDVSIIEIANVDGDSQIEVWRLRVSV